MCIFVCVCVCGLCVSVLSAANQKVPPMDHHY